MEPSTNTRCPKCNAEMEAGFLLDKAYGEQRPVEWIEGQPRKSFWMGITVSGVDHHHVTVYRCVACGFLESYAR